VPVDGSSECGPRETSSGSPQEPLRNL
jgi:hypothetical protein